MTNTPAFKHDRPTIGVLAGWSTLESTTPDHYRVAVIRGIQSAARSQGCHMLLSWGIRPITDANRVYMTWPEVSSEFDFVPVGPWNTDGLIVLTPLANEKQSLYLQQLMAEGFPILFIATGENGPEISVDNHIGIHQAVEHLAQHGHRRIAFIAGLPSDMGDSKTRLEAYHSAVTKYNLDAGPELIDWGLHDFAEGHKAMQRLLKRGIKFTAVVASNDNSAIGAMQAIQEAGLRIPRDIAIIGFDNHPGAIAQVPSLASVHVPLHLIGEQALLLMFNCIVGQSPLESIHIPTRLVQRQSCGCIPDAVSSASIGMFSARSVLAHPSANPDLQALQQQLVDEMMSALPSELRFPGGEQIRQICMILVETFYESLKQENHKRFEAAFIEAVRELEMADASTDYWQEIISILRREMIRLPLLWRQNQTRQLAEDMLHQARAVLDESAQRRDKRHEYRSAENGRTLNTLTAGLSVALSDEQVVELLNTNLPKIGIRHARLLFFEGEQDDSVAWSVLPGLLEDGSHKMRFRSREFPPPDLYAKNELLSIILLPLVFQSEVLGYVAFDASDFGACAVFARQLAATIKVSRLHAQVVELSLTDSLTSLHNRRYLDLFLPTEIARAHRFSHQMSIILIDVDHFKKYNDEFGHPDGDEALRRVAGCLIRERRVTDVVARFGGEEFAIVLPETDFHGALNCAEKVRAAVAAISNLKRPMTISLGIAMLNGNIDKPETLLQQADQALYDAKKTGRNRICVYQEKVTDE
jgi:diguanylate cyclase (GGDEF)-like protein